MRGEIFFVGLLLATAAGARQDPIEHIRSLPAAPAASELKDSWTFFSTNKGSLSIASRFGSSEIPFGQARSSEFVAVINDQQVAFGPPLGSLLACESKDIEPRLPNYGFLESVDLSTHRKPFSAPGDYVWPPRGVSATMVYPLFPFRELVAEVSVDSADGSLNQSISVAIINRSKEPVHLQAFRIPGLRSNGTVVGSLNLDMRNGIEVDQVIPAGRRLTLPRVTFAAPRDFTQEWPSAYRKLAMPWVANAPLTALVSGKDVQEVAIQVRRAKGLGFPAVAMRIRSITPSGMIAAFLAEARKNNLQTGMVFDANLEVEASSHADPGDGFACLASRDADNVMRKAIEQCSRQGITQLFDMTEWSRTCAAGFHGLHQGKAGYGFAANATLTSIVQTCLARKIAYRGRSDARAVGAVSHVTSKLTSSGLAEFAIGLANRGGLVALPNNVRDDRLKQLVQWIVPNQQAFALSPLSATAVCGRVVAAIHEDRMRQVHVVCIGGDKDRLGVEAVIRVPHAPGTEFEGWSSPVVVSPERTIRLKGDLPAGDVRAVSLISKS